MEICILNYVLFRVPLAYHLSLGFFRQLQHALWLERERLALKQIAEKKIRDEEAKKRREAEEV